MLISQLEVCQKEGVKKGGTWRTFRVPEHFFHHKKYGTRAKRNFGMETSFNKTRNLKLQMGIESS